MAELAGKTNLVYILAGTSAMTNSTGAKVNGVDNSTYNHLCDLLDITQFGDTYRKRIAGIADADITISGNLDLTDTNGQNVIVPGAAVYIGVYPSGSAAAGTQIPAIVASVGRSAEAAGKQTFTATFSGNGAPVELPAQV